MPTVEGDLLKGDIGSENNLTKIIRSSEFDPCPGNRDWMALERCTMSWAGGVKGRIPEYKFKDHFFLPIISERRTTPRVRFFCILLTMFGRNRCVASGS